MPIIDVNGIISVVEHVSRVAAAETTAMNILGQKVSMVKQEQRLIVVVSNAVHNLRKIGRQTEGVHATFVSVFSAFA